MFLRWIHCIGGKSLIIDVRHDDDGIYDEHFHYGYTCMHARVTCLLVSCYEKQTVF